MVKFTMQGKMLAFAGMIFIPLLLLGCPYSSKGGGKKPPQELAGVWSLTSFHVEGSSAIDVPVQINGSTLQYMYTAFSDDWKMYVGIQHVDSSKNEVRLYKAKEYSYKVKDNIMTLSDKDGEESASFVLQNTSLTTIGKNEYGKVVTQNFKKVTNPTIDQIKNGKTEQ